MAKCNTELKRVIEIMPYLRELMGSKVNIGVSDLGKILYYDQGNGLTLGIQPGDAIKEGSLPDIAIKTWRRVAKKVSKEIYGKLYMGISVPIKSDNRVIGTYFVSKPADKIDDSIAALSGYTVSEDEMVTAKIPKASQRNLARRKLNSLDHIKKLKSLHKGADYTFNHLVFRSKAMGDLVSLAKKISMNDTSVLICGESGTGKEIFAQAIHNSSSRRHGPFVAVNCAAFPKELIPSELFGYEEGTFTGAIKGGKAGIFELVSGGTIFLDEIGDMPLSAQANLLRVLQEKQITRVGGHRVIPLDVRIIAATNKNLPALVQKKLFRQDLFYRLKVMVLSIPPLRDRREDIALILRHFVAKYRDFLRQDGEIRISLTVEQILSSYDWPGNVRELENMVISILNTMEGTTIEVKDLPPNLCHTFSFTPDSLRTLDELEQEAIKEALNYCFYNISRTAKALGITRATLYRKMKKHKLLCSP